VQREVHELVNGLLTAPDRRTRASRSGCSPPVPPG
jgi:hypothetical protein